MTLIASPPTQTSLIELDEKRKEPFYIAKAWLLWLQDALVARVQQTLQLLTTVAQGVTIGVNAAIGATAIPLPSLSGGTLRVAWYARITTRDPVSSSLTVTIAWIEGGVALTLSGAAMVGNLTTTVQSGTIDIAIDPGTAITYATAYASNTPGTMRYSLRVSVTRVS